MHYRHPPEPVWNRAVAGVAAIAVVSFLARLLLHMPERAPLADESRIQLRWLVPPGAELPVATPPLSAAIAPQTIAAEQEAPQPSLPTTPASTIAEQAPIASKDEKNGVALLYGSDGRPVVPAASDGRQKTQVEIAFEHRDELATGVGERATANLFNGKVAGTGQSRAQRLIYGRDIQAAEARRPPEVAFNPALHERKSDLGSEATGDAYKAAPIRFEKVPDMKGEASRRIRVAIGALEGRYPRCSAEQRSRWMAPALAQLETLQRIEYRFNNGADPTEAEHTLPSAADSAYDQARRALWDAERRMKTCG